MFIVAKKSKFKALPYLPAIADAGKIRDPIHDNIPYSKWEKIIMDTPQFQRLRRIHQAAFIKYVFPGGSHSRFEHSLGVMHTTGMIYESLIFNQQILLHENQSALEQLPQTREKQAISLSCAGSSLLHTKDALEFLSKSDYLLQCTRFAGLLHDVGHGAFSHSGERFMPCWHEFKLYLPQMNIPSWLRDAFTIKLERMKNNRGFEKLITHEIYSLLTIASLFLDEKNVFLSEKMGQDICAVLDTDVEPHPDFDLGVSGVRCLLHEIVSGEVDGDRSDYLLRDSHECGVMYGYFDFGQILDSLCFYKDLKTDAYHLALKKNGVAAFEDFLRARSSMYKQVYFHKTATACEAMLQYVVKNIPNLSLPLDLKEYLAIDDYNFYYYIKEKISQKFTNYKYMIKNLEGLLLHRQLWKRVYEEVVQKETNVKASSRCLEILDYLNKNKIPCEVIENTTNLTNFLPKNQGETSKNSFKVLLKNFDGISYLEPIEQHSSIANHLEENFIIRRIFVPTELENGHSLDLKKLRYNILKSN